MVLFQTASQAGISAEAKESLLEIRGVLFSTERIWNRMVKHLTKDDISKSDISKGDTSKDDTLKSDISKETSKSQDPIKTEMNEWRSRLFMCWRYFRCHFALPSVVIKEFKDQTAHIINGQLVNLFRFCSARHLTAETILQLSKNDKPLETFEYARFEPQAYFTKDSPVMTNIMNILVQKLFPKLDEAIFSLQEGDFGKARHAFISMVVVLLKTIKFGGLNSQVVEELRARVDDLKELDRNWENLTSTLKSNTNKAFFNFKSNKDILSSILMVEYYHGWTIVREMVTEDCQPLETSILIYTRMMSMVLHAKMLSEFAARMKREEGGTKEGHDSSFQSLYVRESTRPKSWDSTLAFEYVENVTRIAFNTMKQDANKLNLKKMIGDHFVKNRKQYSTTLKSQKKVNVGATVSPHCYKRLAKDLEYMDDCLQ